MATTCKRSLVSRAGAAARKVVGRPSPAKKSTATASSTNKTVPPKEAAAKKAAPVKKAAAKKAAPVKKAAVKKAAPVRKAAATTTPAPTSAPGRTPAAKLVVLEAEEPWTKDELNEVRSQLRADVKRLSHELDESAGDLADLMRDAGEGAGSDQADVGSATFERDQEMTIVNNARDMLQQSEHALERIADGTYGVCEVCGNPIGKNRLMVFPRATMCLTCKQREERR
jgi:RNA polymerase-binding protein DksA